MNIRKFGLRLPLVAFLILPVLAYANAPTDKGATNAKPPTPAAESVLKQGMPAADVIKRMGKPDHIRPMEAPSGKAEVWVYTRQVGNRVARVGLPTADVMTSYTGADGKMRQSQSPGPLAYHEVNYITEETVEILIFNSHFLTQKTSRAERQTFQ